MPRGRATTRSRLAWNVVNGGVGVKRWVTIVIGAIVGLVGLVWIAQGVGLIGGSAMSGAPAFVVFGAGLVIAAVVILARARRAADGG